MRIEKTRISSLAIGAYHSWKRLHGAVKPASYNCGNRENDK